MSHPARQRLEDLLDREVDAARDLSRTLDAERAALTGDSPQAVEDKAAEKVRLFGTIEALEADRRALWGASAADGSGLDGTLTQRWRALMELMARCRTANEVNGHIIHIRQNQTRQLLDIVRGGTPVTYGPHGKTFATSLRALARA